MREETNVVSAIKIAAILLVLNSVHGNSREAYERPRRGYFSYENFNGQSLDIPRKWPFNKQNTIRITRHSLAENDMLRNDKFIFPDTDIKPVQSRIDTVPACEGQTYCEHVPNYPTGLVNEVLRKYGYLRTYNNTDMLDIIHETRFSSEQFCSSSEQIVFPKAGETMKKEQAFIINTEDFKQGVRVETCLNHGTKCNIISDFAEGYRTSCEQKYSFRQLARPTKDLTMKYDYFKFPTSCCCRIEFAGLGLGPRIGINRSNGPKSKRIDKNTD